MGSSVLLSVSDGVARLTLDDPATRNALSAETAQAIASACAAIDSDESVGAVIVGSSSGFFCSGGNRRDLATVARDPFAMASRETLNAIYDAFVSVGQLKCPTIAAVRGGAVGAGLNLLLACDLRVVAETSVLSGFSALGVHPGGGNLALLLRSGTREAAVAIAALGETSTGADWARHGLCWSAVPDEQVDAEADRLAERAARDPVLTRSVMSSLRAEFGPPLLPWPVALNLEREPQLRSFARRTAAEGNPFARERDR
jgi:enoyl-CoA hydratase